MASTRQPILHDNLIGGVETALPAHLVAAQQWRACHNMRFAPALQQVLRKKNYTQIGSTDVLDISVIPSLLPGYGKLLVFQRDSVRLLNGVTMASGLATDNNFRRWAVAAYNGALYYTNELNKARMNNGSTDTTVGTDVANIPSGRFVAVYYDHLFVGYPTFQNSPFPDRIMWSDLYNFGKWVPDATNEADFYDFVEWQQTDYPFSGVTGMKKLRGMLVVYTPSAIVPCRYVGKPSVMQVVDDGVVARCGNVFPYALVALDTVHFFYDGLERNFFAYDGQGVTPIGDSIRRWFNERINPDPALAAKTWAYVDTNNREIWWVYVSEASNGPYDQAVVFNYRLKRWSTASSENIQAFCFKEQVASQLSVGQLQGVVGSLAGSVSLLGTGSGTIPKLYGSSDGRLLTDEVEGDATVNLLTQEDPVLETGDFHYGDITMKKENDAMSVNAVWDVVRDPTMQLQVQVSGREYLEEDVDWTDVATIVGNWNRTLKEKWLDYPAKEGKVLRYRFVATNARGLKVSAFEDSVYMRKAEK
jgi:hypothetical protein